MSASAAVIHSSQFPRHSQLVLIGFWPSVKLSDALSVCAMRAHNKQPKHLNLAPGDVYAFNLMIPPQRSVPVAKIFVDRLHEAQKRLGLQIKTEFIDRVRQSEATRNEQRLREADYADFRCVFPAHFSNSVFY